MTRTFVKIGDIDYPGSTMDLILKAHHIGQGDIINSFLNKDRDQLLKLAYDWIKLNSICVDRKRNISIDPLKPITLSNSLALIPITLFKDGVVYKVNRDPIAFFSLDFKNYNHCNVRIDRFKKEVDELEKKVITNQSSNPNDIFSTNSLIRRLLHKYFHEYLEGIKIDKNTYVIEQKQDSIFNFKIAIKKLEELSVITGLKRPVFNIEMCSFEELNPEDKINSAAGYSLFKIDELNKMLKYRKAGEINRFDIRKVNMKLTELSKFICDYKFDGFNVYSEYENLLNNYQNVTRNLND